MDNDKIFVFLFIYIFFISVVVVVVYEREGGYVIFFEVFGVDFLIGN